jgi:hypothetical protein
MKPEEIDVKRPRQALSGMPCDNIDDPREAAINEMLAEQAEIELGIWQANAAEPVSESSPPDRDH